MLGAERQREISEGQTNEKLGRGQGFSRGLWRFSRKALFRKRQGAATLHLWFRQRSQLSSHTLPTVDFRYRTTFWRAEAHNHGPRPQAICTKAEANSTYTDPDLSAGMAQHPQARPSPRPQSSDLKGDNTTAQIGNTEASGTQTSHNFLAGLQLSGSLK